MSEQVRRPKRGLAIASCVLGILSLPTFGLLFVGALVGLVLGIAAVVRESRNPAEFGGRTWALVGIATAGLSLLLTPFLMGIAGIAAAIAIPSLLRARVAANEKAVVEDMRTVADAETRYARTNGGYFDRLECLQGPTDCGRAAAPFLTRIPAIHSGYLHVFHPGPEAPGPDVEARRLSATSLRGYALTFLPVARGQTGVRSFCGDSQGRYCTSADGSAPDVVDGACQLVASSGRAGEWGACRSARPSAPGEPGPDP